VDHEDPQKSSPSSSWRNPPSGYWALVSALSVVFGLVAGVAEFMDNGFIKGMRQLLISGAIVVVILVVALAVKQVPRVMVGILVIVTAIAVGAAAGFVLGERRGHVVTPDPDPSASSSPAPSISPSPSPSSSPSSSEPPPPAGVTVTFDDSEPDPIEPASEFDLSGTISGLPSDHRLFIVSRNFARNSDYFIVEGDWVEVVNGRWTAHDGGVGSPEDKARTRFKFMAVDANEECRTGISKALAEIKKNDAHRVYRKSWPAACEDGILDWIVVVLK
jgi:hypothetical protein